jgi:hypothetical protein
MAFTVSVQAAIPSASLKPATDGKFVVEVGPGEDERVMLLILGDCAGSDPGGDPTPEDLTFTNEPQLKEPGSVGGVTV